MLKLNKLRGERNDSLFNPAQDTFHLRSNGHMDTDYKTEKMNSKRMMLLVS